MRAGPSQALTGRGKDGLRTIQRHNGQENPIWKLRPPLRGSANADKALHTVVTRLQIRVVQGPIHPVPIPGSGFEFVISHAIRGTSPVQTPAAQAARSTPLVRGVGSGSVRVLLV